MTTSSIIWQADALNTEPVQILTEVEFMESLNSCIEHQVPLDIIRQDFANVVVSSNSIIDRIINQIENYQIINTVLTVAVVTGIVGIASIFN